MAIEHISDRDLADLLCDPTRPRPHLQECSSCRAEVERIRASLRTLRSISDSAATKPDHFWQQQQEAIRNLIVAGAPAATSIPRLAWAAVAALMVMGIALLLTTTPAPAPHARYDADHELLVEVERALQSNGPAALEPATLLTPEISQNVLFTVTPQIHKKENKHED